MNRHMDKTRASPNKQLLNHEHLVFFGDGVVAITLTLLVLDLKLPVADAAKFPQALERLGPRLAIYLFALATIANQWAIHRCLAVMVAPNLRVVGATEGQA